MSRSSCDGFHSERREVRGALNPDGGAPDAASRVDLTDPAQCEAFCEENGAYGTMLSCTVESADGGSLGVCSFNTICKGRRPQGWQAPERELRAPLLAQYFAEMAATEAASVHAFERLAEELRAFAISEELVRRAKAAAVEEARHYRMTAALARRFGAHTRMGSMTVPAHSRTLFDLAAENAREGVVGETLGAAFGWWQARHSREPAVRAVMRRIAAEETSHAVLSWDIDAALRQRLGETDCVDLDAVTNRALQQAEKELDSDVATELVHRGGLPPRRVAHALLVEARTQFWT